MKLHQSSAEVFIPDGLSAEQALIRTTHLAIGAHPDDIEIMAARPILECFERNDRWLTSIILTDGSGSPRGEIYKDYSDEEIKMARFKEQKKAAVIGQYSALVLLDYPSEVIRESSTQQPIDDLCQILKITNPKYVYTHNLADKHDTHVSTVLKVIAAIRRLPESERPEQLFGCEVWRDLDWMVDADKVSFDLSVNENLQETLLGVFDSQINGGKRIDMASLGRRRANATFYESQKVDEYTGLSFAMDLSPLIHSPEQDILQFVQDHIHRFDLDVTNRLTRLS